MSTYDAEVLDSFYPTKHFDKEDIKLLELLNYLIENATPSYKECVYGRFFGNFLNEFGVEELIEKWNEV